MHVHACMLFSVKNGQYFVSKMLGTPHKCDSDRLFTTYDTVEVILYTIEVNLSVAEVILYRGHSVYSRGQSVYSKSHSVYSRGQSVYKSFCIQ